MTTDPHATIPEWTVGDRLRKARQLTGLTTRDFAKAIGVSQATITSAETGARTPRRITLLAYAMRSGVPIEWIETGEEPHAPGPDGGGQIESHTHNRRTTTRHARTDVWALRLAA